MRVQDGLTDFDWGLVTFVAQWARYGGPDPEETLPRFGMSCVRLRERLEQIVTYVDRHPIPLSQEQKEHITRAERWLATLDAGSPYGELSGAESVPADPLGAPGQPALKRGIWRWQ